MAVRGAPYRRILHHYYSGVSIRRARAASLEVGLAWGRRRVSVAGPLRVMDAWGRTLVARTRGTASFHWAGAGVVGIDVGNAPRPLLVTVANVPAAVAPGEVASLTVELSRPGTAQLLTSARGGAPTRSTPVRLRAGRRRLAWVAPSAPGTYRVQVLVSARRAFSRSRPVDITVRAVRSHSGRPQGARDATTRRLGAAAGAVLLVVALACVRLVGRMRS